MKRSFYTYFILVILFISCTKELTIETDIIKPEINIVYPLDNPVIPAGYPLCMKVLIHDNKNLSSVWLEVNDGYGFNKKYDIPGQSMEIIEKYIAVDGDKRNLIAKFFAMDETGNLSSEEIKFTVNN
jgi:hypothetical protein